MKMNYLFPNKYKVIGLFILIPTVILGLLTLFLELEPALLDLNVPAIFMNELFQEKELFGLVENNFFNEILGVLLIVSSLMVAFSKEKLEDEYISKIRLESLVWAVFVNYGILFVSFLVLYGLSFLWVMLFNMFTVLLFFIIRFNLQVSKLNKTADHEE